MYCYIAIYLSVFQASGEKIDSLREKGDQLIAEGNLDSERIKFQLDEVVSGWNELIT
jgi:hypothetical protein